MKGCAGMKVMNKRLLIWIELLLLIFKIFGVSSIHAQLISPRVGVTFSNTTTKSSSPSEFNYITGLMAGAGFEFTLKRQLAILVEADFIVKGYNYYLKEPNQISSNYSDITDINYKQNFLEVPVIIKEYFGRENLRFYVNGGIYGAFGLGGTKKGYKGTFVNGNTVDYEEYDGKIKYGPNPDYPPDRNNVYYDSRFDAGLILGTGTVLFERYALDIRYEWGWANKHYQTWGIAFSLPIKLTDTKE